MSYEMQPSPDSEEIALERLQLPALKINEELADAAFFQTIHREYDNSETFTATQDLYAARLLKTSHIDDLHAVSLGARVGMRILEQDTLMLHPTEWDETVAENIRSLSILPVFEFSGMMRFASSITAPYNTSPLLQHLPKSAQQDPQSINHLNKGMSIVLYGGYEELSIRCEQLTQEMENFTTEHR